MKRKTLTLFLALVMCLGLLPLTTLAAEDASATGWVVTEVVPFQYEKVHSFSEGLAAVMLDGEWGFIDRTGKEVVPCKYLDVSSFSEGFAVVVDDITVLDGGYILNCGIVNKTGEEIVPCKYNAISKFYEGVALVGVYERDSKWEGRWKWGFIDKTGREIVPCKYDDKVNDFSDYPREDWEGFIKGRAAVYSNGKWGWIDPTGQEVIPCKYTVLRYITSEGHAIVANEENLWGIVDITTGEELLPCKYRNVGEFSEGLAAVENENSKWGFVDKTDKAVIPCQYDHASNFQDGLAAVMLNDRWGFIDKTGAEVIPCTLNYDIIVGFNQETGLANVGVGDYNRWKWGFIDKTGAEVVPPLKYDRVVYFCDNLATVERDGKVGFIDKAGQEVVPCKYDQDSAYYFSEGLVDVKLDRKLGFIDKTGQEVIPCKYDYDSARSFSEGLASMKLSGKCGFIDTTGKEIVPYKYDNAYNFSEGLAAVQLDDKWGFISITKAETPQPTSTPITQSMFTVDTAAETYTGKAITKSVYGVDGDTALVEGADYTAAYKDNINVGTATITITGMGSYTGTLTYTFTIKAASSGNNNSSGGGGSRPSGGGGGGGSTTTPPPAQAGTPASELFTDVVKDSWYEPGVTYVVNKGLFKGVREGVFSPNTNMTRAMVMTVLARMDGQDTTNAANGPWYADIMRWAVAKGITDGTMPDSGVTREQLVTLLYRYAKAGDTVGDLAAFSDGNRVSAWAVGPMTWAVKEGILTGKNGNRLDPQGLATRAEVATIFQRFVEARG